MVETFLPLAIGISLHCGHICNFFFGGGGGGEGGWMG